MILPLIQITAHCLVVKSSKPKLTPRCTLFPSSEKNKSRQQGDHNFRRLGSIHSIS
jgi:hypothetical protein